MKIIRTFNFSLKAQTHIKCISALLILENISPFEQVLFLNLSFY